MREKKQVPEFLSAAGHSSLPAASLTGILLGHGP